MAVALSLEAQRASVSQGKPWLLLSSPFVSHTCPPAKPLLVDTNPLVLSSGCSVPSTGEAPGEPWALSSLCLGWGSQELLVFLKPLAAAAAAACLAFRSSFQLGFPEW